MDEWIGAWNAHDLERILSHYTDDVIFRSPRAAQVVGTGVVEGKAALRTYWAKALALRPDLHFEAPEVYAGAGALTITYLGVGGRKAAETFEFAEDGRVRRSVACYV